MVSRRDAWPLGAVGFIFTVSVLWWTLALWSVPDAPEWLERTRAVCFNLTETGLPDAKGWLLLIGQPPAMLAVLLVGWGGEVRASMGRLVSSTGGRLTALAAGSALAFGLSLAATRVLAARVAEVTWDTDAPAPVTYPRLDRTWPVTPGLVDASGEAFALEALRGRPAMLTFAFGHCRTICPAVVHQARAARLELDEEWVIVVLTLDPWRDTPGRLPSLVEQFSLDPRRDFVVSGAIADVNVALDAWNIPRERDERTGDITHPGVVYLVEGDGTVAYGAAGGAEQLVSLARRVE